MRHAKLSPSSAARWLRCTPSATMEQNIDIKTDSSFSNEGTRAHKCAESYLNFMIYGTPLEADIYSEEIERAAMDYIDFALIKMAEIDNPNFEVEKEVDLSHIAPESFGTVDFKIEGPDVTHIIDFKFGVGVKVKAEENEQLKLYALGAIKGQRIKRVLISVAQPRLNHFDTWETTAQDLSRWGKSISKTAKAAFKGEGELLEGEYCNFCKAAPVCALKAEKYKDTTVFNGSAPNVLSLEEIESILPGLDKTVAWLGKVKKYAIDQLEQNGAVFDSFKLVKGKGTRFVADLKRLEEEAQKAGINRSKIYNQKINSLSQLEKLFGNEGFKKLEQSGIIDKKFGSNTVAHKDDKRIDLNKNIFENE